MASQGPQPSQDLKDENVEPGGDRKEKLAVTLTRLAAKYAKQALMDDIKKGKELYNANFVPWIMKMVETGRLKPGQSTDVAPQDMGLPETSIPECVWEQVRALADEDGVDVGKQTWDEYRQEFSASVLFQVTDKN